MKARTHKLLYTVMLLPSAAALAQEHEISGGKTENSFHMNVGVTSEYTDNVTKREFDPISDRQDIYNLGVDAHYTNDWIALNSNYAATQYVYQKELLPDYGYFEGTTGLTLGNSYSPASLLVSHSRRSMLNEPDAVDLTVNQDQRDIITVQPALKWRATSADVLMLAAVGRSVTFREDERKKSRQTGGQLGWVRGLSQVSEFRLTAESSKTSFENFDGADYKFESLTALYSVTLSRLSYSLQLGVNKAKPETAVNDYTRPSYNVESTYRTLYNTFTFSASQFITNSSSGDGNAMDMGSIDNTSSGAGIDLITLRNLRLGWSTTMVCENCTLLVSAASRHEDYRVLADDGTSTMFGGSFTYAFSRAASVVISGNHTKKDFDDGSNEGSYSSKNARVSLNYHFRSGVDVKVYREFENRDSESITKGRRYDEHVTGLHLSYSF